MEGCISAAPFDATLGGARAYSFSARSCAQRDASGERRVRATAKALGLKLSRDLQPGMWVIVESRAERGEVFWLARTVSVGGWDGKCTSAVTDPRTHDKVRYDSGDVIVASGGSIQLAPQVHRDLIVTSTTRPQAVQWYKRLAGHSERRTYERERNTTGRPWTDYFNSCELRVANAAVELVGGPPLPPTGRRMQRGLARSAEEDREGQRLWSLEPQSEAMALAECKG